MRIFIDCTDAYSNSLNTGIQRVVRNLCNCFINTDKNLIFSCQPVILANGKYTPVNTTISDRYTRKINISRASLNNFYYFLISEVADFIPKPWRPFVTGSKHEHSLARLIVYVFSPLINVFQSVNRHTELQNGTLPAIQFKEGDILLLADCVWNYSPWPALHAAKSSGAHIAAIVYDIIPITHGQFFSPTSREKFAVALPLLLQNADTFFCISAYTQDQLRNHYAAQPYAKILAPKRFYDFPLGAELGTLDATGQVRTKIRSLFSSTRSVYLAVGTLEPRKNHAYLLQAFQKLWDEGGNLALLIVGRVGWMCEDLLETIRRHPMFGQQLIFMDDVSDVELDYCYEHAHALLLSSVVEGFGLPIIEALRKRLPVFASDIPVFHEVGGEYVVYFDLADPASLADLLMAYEVTGKYIARPPADFDWPDWSQSTAALLTQLAEMR